MTHEAGFPLARPSPGATEVRGAQARRLAAARIRFDLPAGPEMPEIPLAGDAGARCYYRVATRGGATVLVVLYPEPESVAQANWTAIGAALTAAGVRVPALHDDAPDIAAALVEDLGDLDLAAELCAAPRENRPSLLGQAERLLEGVRAIAPAAARRNPAFDAAFFEKELAHTRRWALEKGGNAPLSPERGAEWDRLASFLSASASDPATSGVSVPAHRDFHANNIMRAPDGRLALIDFQDLRMAPPHYDRVSLRFERAGEAVGCDARPYAEAVLLQRAWKVLGTFEKMLSLGREIYRPHRDTAVRVIRRCTTPGGPFVPLLAFLS